MTGSVKSFSKVITGVTLLSISACAIGPVPGNYYPLVSQSERDFERISKLRSNFTTVNIVRQIRCEARASVAGVVMDNLKADLDAVRNAPDATPSERAFVESLIVDGQYDFDKLVNDDRYYRQDTGQFLASLKAIMIGDELRDLPLGGELKLVEEFAASGVGYTFTLTAREENNARNGMLGFTFPKVGGTKLLTLNGQYDRRRENKRVFSFSETVGELVFDRELDQVGYCNERLFNRNIGKNFHYPIYGSIGLKELFQTYAWLPFVSPFGGDDSAAKNQQAGGQLIDTINFRTTVGAGATPQLTILPSVNPAHITSASANFGNTRYDEHQLRIVIQTNGVTGLLDSLIRERQIEASLDGSFNR
ncbi:MAG: hypothetical protein AAF742_01485 [Pseudomonadota bacterium]